MELIPWESWFRHLCDFNRTCASGSCGVGGDFGTRFLRPPKSIKMPSGVSHTHMGSDWDSMRLVFEWSRVFKSVERSGLPLSDLAGTSSTDGWMDGWSSEAMKELRCDDGPMARNYNAYCICWKFAYPITEWHSHSWPRFQWPLDTTPARSVIDHQCPKWPEEDWKRGSEDSGKRRLRAGAASHQSPTKRIPQISINFSGPACGCEKANKIVISQCLWRIHRKQINAIVGEILQKI